MAGDCRKEIVRHPSEDDLDRLLAETDDDKISKRLTFVKQLYKAQRSRTLPTTEVNPTNYREKIRVFVNRFCGLAFDRLIVGSNLDVFVTSTRG